MEAQKISDQLQGTYPEHKVVQMGPPAGVAEEDCYTLEVLADHVKEGAFEGAPLFRSYWKPNEQELAVLNNGGYTELVVIGMFPPVMMGVKDS